MSTTPEPKPRLPRDHDHTGKCTVGTCKCEAFVHYEHADGFAICECRHTRWSHVKVERVPEGKPGPVG